jgi:tetratricopeptide (TPR) repeat protein/2-polyprenyl-3-methyl-5-hydroxy-6-metoxy-1,4-benzoquinol methylase
MPLMSKGTSRKNTAALQRLLGQATQFHRQGRLSDAEPLYLRILRQDPDQFEALHLLGVLRGQEGRYREALDLIGAALTVRSDAAEARQNYALILHKLSRHEEALALFDQLLAVRPDAFEALGNRGNVLCALGRHRDGLESYDRALAIRPNYPEALNNRGNVLCVLGRYEEAVASYSRALAYRPGDAETLHNRGNALRALDRYEEALASFDRALTANPDFADALSDRGGVLQELGRHDEALACYETALAVKPDHAEAILGFAAILIARGQASGALHMVIRALEIDETAECKTLFVECVKDLEPAGDVGELKRLVLRAMLEPWARPSTLSAVCARLIKIDGDIRESMARAACAWPKLLPAEELLGPRGLEAISGDRLLECLLVTTPVVDIELERFLTALRCSMLDAAEGAAASDAADAAVLSFCCALARQCFINEYVFACTDAELERCRRLRDKMVTALAAGAPISALWPAAVAAYFPLGELPGAQILVAGDWPDALDGLLVQQVEEPRSVRECAAFIPRLTAIADDASLQVRRQYEENPYPRWVTMAPGGRRTTVRKYLQGLFPFVPVDGLDESRGVDILVAGCGTGQHSIGTAQQYVGGRVLAIDLSLASLCYAKYRTESFGIDNIEYAQADILELGSVDRMFDLIEASGVLHHLADPLLGWRMLLSRLRPNGVMRVGLYSELARRDIVAARTFIAERGYRPTAADIRRCRQELMSFADGTPLKNVAAGDFFTISGCRDLLFHAQEHRFTLPGIGAFLAENDLTLLGFDLGGRTRLQYRTRFPGDRSMTQLGLWHVFESENPGTFLGMYQFWVQKKI